MICERKVTVHNRAGIHCRPAGVIIDAMRGEFPGHRFEIITPYGDVELDGMLALIAQCLTCGTETTLRVEGPDAERAAQRIGDLFEHNFDFPHCG